MNQPDKESLIAAYHVTAQVHSTESQLIWMRTGIFVAFNSLVAAALHYVGEIPSPIRLVIAVIGCVYSFCWHISMNRMWQYHKYFVLLMREQEKLLGLNMLGTYSRGKAIVEGSPSSIVDGEEIKFIPPTLVFRAKFLADITTWLFFLVYFISVIKVVLNR